MGLGAGGPVGPLVDLVALLHGPVGGPVGPVGGPDGPAAILSADVCASTESSILGFSFGSTKLLTCLPCFWAPIKAKPDISRHNTANIAKWKLRRIERHIGIHIDATKSAS